MATKCLIVLNPLIQQMLDEDAYSKLLDEIKAWGHQPTDSAPGIAEVKRQYQECLFETKTFPVIDSRCPKIRKMLIEEFPDLMELRAPIDPILVTGAKIRRKECGNKNIEMVIVTPCEAFSYIHLSNTRMITWREFKGLIHFYPPQKMLDESPVPLGFFDSLGVKVYGASGEENCRKLLTDMPSDAELLELLWCEGGCHKGDGL